jgi:O-antigen/teichoic acid export membrane protein
LLAPSFGFTIVPLSNALMIQGMVILSATYSGQAAAIFSATRVIIFAARQLALAGPRAVWPELTKSFSTENYESSQRLVGIAAIYMIAVFCGVILVLALCGEFIFCYLTGGKLVFDYALFGMLAICSALSSVSWMGYMIKGSTNNHGRFAIFGLLVAISIYVFSYLNRVEIYSWRIYLPLAGGELAIAILALSGSRDIVFGRNHRD